MGDRGCFFLQLPVQLGVRLLSPRCGLSARCSVPSDSSTEPPSAVGVEDDQHSCTVPCIDQTGRGTIEVWVERTAAAEMEPCGGLDIEVFIAAGPAGGTMTAFCSLARHGSRCATAC